MINNASILSHAVPTPARAVPVRKAAAARPNDGNSTVVIAGGHSATVMMRMSLLFLMLMGPAPQLLTMGAVLLLMGAAPLLLMQFLLMEKVPMCLESRLCNRA